MGEPTRLGYHTGCNILVKPKSAVMHVIDRLKARAWPVHRLSNLSCCFVLDDNYWIKVVWNLPEVLAFIPFGTKYIKQFLPYLLAICIASFKNSPFRPMALCYCSFVFYRLIRFIAGILFFFFSFLRAAFTCD